MVAKHINNKIVLMKIDKGQWNTKKKEKKTGHVEGVRINKKKTNQILLFICHAQIAEFQDNFFFFVAITISMHTIFAIYFTIQRRCMYVCVHHQMNYYGIKICPNICTRFRNLLGEKNKRILMIKWFNNFSNSTPHNTAKIKNWSGSAAHTTNTFMVY